MAMDRNSNMAQSLMGFSFFSYFKACFFAGLFCRAIKPSLSGV